MMSSLAQNIERLMRDAGFNQKSLAKASDLNETYIRDILKGRSKNPEASRLERVARVLECSIDDLLPRAPRAVIGGHRMPLDGQVDGESLHARQKAALIAIWDELSFDERSHLIGLLEAMRRFRSSRAA